MRFEPPNHGLQAFGFLVFLIGFGIGITSVIRFFSEQVGDEVGEVLPAAAEAAESQVVENSSPVVALIMVVIGIVFIALGSKQRP